ncbi:MAG: diaminopimelate epimerase [Cyanobacteriota bacterium]
MTEIHFTKMHGLGNDFIIVEDKDLPDDIDYSELSKCFCDRHFGIGGDGLIIINPKNGNYETDTAWRIFNSDGSEPQMCGNGIRCFARYVYDKGIVQKKEFTVNTLAGVITPTIESELIKVDMGKPIIEPSLIPVKINLDRALMYSLVIQEKEFKINCISMGNPHCVIFIEEFVDLKKWGPLIETHELFPEKTNVEFVKKVDSSHIKVNVWERGCGITLACGTGACACVVAGVLNNLIDTITKVTLPGGDLFITFDQNLNRVFMSGPAEYSFSGMICL